MIEEIVGILLGYIFMFLVVSFIKFSYPNLKFCPKCATFFSVLVIVFLFYKIPAPILGYMLGMSVTGAAYTTTIWLTKKNKKFAQSYIDFAIQWGWAILGFIALAVIYG